MKKIRNRWDEKPDRRQQPHFASSYLDYFFLLIIFISVIYLYHAAS